MRRPLPHLLRSPHPPRRTLAPTRPFRPRPSLSPVRRLPWRRPAVPNDRREVLPFAVQTLVDDPAPRPARGLSLPPMLSRTVHAAGTPVGVTDATCAACAEIATWARVGVPHVIADVRARSWVPRAVFRAAPWDVAIKKWSTVRVTAQTRIRRRASFSWVVVLMGCRFAFTVRRITVPFGF